MRQHLRTPLLCLLAILLTCTALAKASKPITLATKAIEKSIDVAPETAIVTTINASSSNFAANAPLMHEVSSTTAIDMSLFLKGFFYGFLIMVILVNLMSYLIFNDKIFKYFGIALIACAILFFNADNLFSLFTIDVSAYNLALTTTLLCLSMGLLAVFSSGYLTIEDNFPKLKAFTSPLFIASAVLAACTWFTDDTLFALIANVLSFSLVTCYFSAGLLLFSKNNYAKFYVITSSIPLLFAVDYFLLGGLGIQFLNTETVHMKTAFFIGMLVMTYAIIYRTKVIKEENLIRKTEMQLFLKRQETLSRESIARMVEDVYLENLIMHYDLDGLEIKLLQYISDGKENKKIARKLNTTEQDVEQLTKDLYHKLEIGEAVKEDYNLLDSQPDYLYN